MPNKDQASFMVVSPDGSFRKTLDGPAIMMYENKCKAPNSFSSTAYYEIPHYYVVQLLSEMYAYGCSERRGEKKKSRPIRFSPIAKGLKNSVKKFTETNFTLLGEFPACKAVIPSFLMNGQEQEHSEPYLKPNIRPRAPGNVSISHFQESLVIAKKWFDHTYQLLRSVASEILVFMVNDLDRMFHMELSNAHPIVYALKGPSMKADAFRNMTDNVWRVKRICVFEHSVMTNFDCACPAIQKGQGSGFLSESSS